MYIFIKTVTDSFNALSHKAFSYPICFHQKCFFFSGKYLFPHAHILSDSEVFIFMGSDVLLEVLYFAIPPYFAEKLLIHLLSLAWSSIDYLDGEVLT